MFTGIIECLGKVVSLSKNGTNISFCISSPISNSLKIDQSVSHDGVCLTVESCEDGKHCVTAIEETLIRSNLSNWKVGTEINMERCMILNGRLDGHIVQGHVDTTALCNNRVENNGSWTYSFQIPLKFSNLIIEKGSIAVNGTSLTCFEIGKDCFSVGIIPFTFQHTTIQHVQKGTFVNIEFDILGKYVQRQLDMTLK